MHPFFLVICTLLLTSAGCATSSPQQTQSMSPAQSQSTMLAQYTNTPITLDGHLDEPAWQQAQAYPLLIAPTDTQVRVLRDPHLASGKSDPYEAGTARVLWDDANLYVGVEFTDSDIVAYGTNDQMHHYVLGDVAELFLKPVNETWIWEMYATPAGRKSALFFPGRGEVILQDAFKYQSRLEIAAHVDGTLNQWHDRDKSWSAEFKIPLEELSAAGIPLTPDTPWLILIARFNYNRYLPDYEMSSAPRLPFPDSKLYEQYAQLKLVQ